MIMERSSTAILVGTVLCLMVLVHASERPGHASVFYNESSVQVLMHFQTSIFCQWNRYLCPGANFCPGYGVGGQYSIATDNTTFNTLSGAVNCDDHGYAKTFFMGPTLMLVTYTSGNQQKEYQEVPNYRRLPSCGQ